MPSDRILHRMKDIAQSRNLLDANDCGYDRERWVLCDKIINDCWNLIDEMYVTIKQGEEDGVFS